MSPAVPGLTYSFSLFKVQKLKALAPALEEATAEKAEVKSEESKETKKKYRRQISGDDKGKSTTVTMVKVKGESAWKDNAEEKDEGKRALDKVCLLTKWCKFCLFSW